MNWTYLILVGVVAYLAGSTSNYMLYRLRLRRLAQEHEQLIQRLNNLENQIQNSIPSKPSHRTMFS